MFPNFTPTYEGVGPTYGVDGGMYPPFQRNPWKKAEDPIGPLWALCAKEVGIVCTLGIPVTIPPEALAKFVGTGGQTTLLARVNGVVGILVLGAPTRGGGTPLAGAAEVEVEDFS